MWQLSNLEEKYFSQFEEVQTFLDIQFVFFSVDAKSLMQEQIDLSGKLNNHKQSYYSFVLDERDYISSVDHLSLVILKKKNGEEKVSV